MFDHVNWIAVIGAGRLGGFHAQKLARRDDVTLAAVVVTGPAVCRFSFADLEGDG